MASLNGKEILGNLKKKGFTAAAHKSNDHNYLEFFEGDKLITHTKLSHGSKKDIGPSLVGQMARQCKMTKQEFIDFASCKISKDEYRQILANQDLIDFESE